MTKLMELGSTLRWKPGSWQEFVWDVCIGLVTGAGHFLYFLRNWFIERPLTYVLGMDHNIFQTNQKLRKGEGKLKVVGVGFGRTGTYSLTLALDELEYPTLHTQHLYENEDIFRMWMNNVFQPSLDSGHATVGQPDFDIIAQHGYQATMDFPTALYYEQILKEYPDCKFILTTRQDSETWFRSWEGLAKSITSAANVGGSLVSAVKQYTIYLRWLYAMVNEDDSYLTSPEPRDDQNHYVAIRSYERHNARVKQIIPPNQLLEYNVKDEWKPLCEFLNVPVDKCPNKPFPKTNSARSVQIQSISSYVFPLLIVSWISMKFFRKATGKTVVEWVRVQTDLVHHRLQKTMLSYKSCTPGKDLEEDGDGIAAAVYKHS
ncbi:unnamed protein product [Cylindrotheca closterium]|uniref:Uncharacterized protein n=1 Tax=Cylindrotheca closterium TaxID=2856 RepID=A0AAD2G8I7_9STRA|nr:unnamed protein product [Cylindrotheca closterium]